MLSLLSLKASPKEIKNTVKINHYFLFLAANPSHLHIPTYIWPPGSPNPPVHELLLELLTHCGPAVTVCPLGVFRWTLTWQLGVCRLPPSWRGRWRPPGEAWQRQAGAALCHAALRSGRTQCRGAVGQLWPAGSSSPSTCKGSKHTEVDI